MATSTRHAPATPFAKPRPGGNPLPSSSPAFATPAHPLRQPRAADALRPSVLPQTTAYGPHDVAPNPTELTTSSPVSSRPSTPAAASRQYVPPPILPILLPPQTLRPIAFRTFTKKHNLTLTSSSLSLLASFVGKHCGSKWREEGLAEPVLEEVARSWKKADGKVIVDSSNGEQGEQLRRILKTLEGCMVGGRIALGARKAGLSRQGSLISLDGNTRPGGGLTREDSFGISRLDVQGAEAEEDDEDDIGGGVRRWMKVVDAFEQPRLIFNSERKHFEKSKQPVSFFPSPTAKTELFRQRYHLVHQRLLRNDSFQESVISRTGPDLAHQAWKVTPIANLRGRNGTGHLLLGLLAVMPSGTLAINDLTGSVHVDLEQAAQIDDLETWICPGMVLLVDGVYEEEYSGGGTTLGTSNGVGGTIGGRFMVFSIGAPRCETRAASLGLSDPQGVDTGTVGGGFGWVDFLGVGSERALGARMRRIEHHTLRQLHHSPAEDNASKVIVLGELHLDSPLTLSALRRIFDLYSPAPPAGFILLGSFISNAALSSPSSTGTDVSDTSSIAYKEHFDALAALLADFPTLLRQCTFVFVPGDNDPWPSAFASGGACALPRKPVPEMFTTRIKRAFANANSAADRDAKDGRPPGEAIWTTNPSRLTIFGPRHELVLMRDDVSGRLRRSAVPLKKQHGQQHGQQQNVPESDAQVEDVQMVDAPAPAPPSSPPSPTAAAAVAVDDADAMDISSRPPGRRPAPELLDPSTQHARRLTKTLLDQSHLAPFALSARPVHWAHAHALSLYPLPSALVLCDAEAEAFVVVYQGCCVVNAGKLVGSWAGRKGGARWVEFDVRGCRGTVREMGL